MCKCNQAARIEVLPTGEKVFYVDIGTMASSDVQVYMEKIMERMKDRTKPDERNYFIPVRPTMCECVNNHGITLRQLWTLILSQIVAVAGFLLFWG